MQTPLEDDDRFVFGYLVYLLMLFFAVGFALQNQPTIGDIRIPSVTFSLWIWSGGLLFLVAVAFGLFSLVSVIVLQNIAKAGKEHGYRMSQLGSHMLPAIQLIISLIVWHFASVCTRWLSSNWSSIEGWVSLRYVTDHEYQHISGVSTFWSSILFVPMACVVLMLIASLAKMEIPPEIFDNDR